ncbi:MAG TPA: hypothetical protein VF327_01335 [Gaiellaceae bacterium]
MKARMRPAAVALAGAALVGVPIAAALLLRPGSGAQASAPIPAPVAAAPSGPRFPAPPEGAVVYSRQLGSDALALGVVPRRGSVLVQASVVGPQGRGVSGLAVTFVVQRSTKAATACGAGCYRATLATKGRPASVDLVLRGRQSAHWRVALPATWPPPDSAALLARAGAVWRSLRSLSVSESLASGTGHVALSTWRIQAPDRIAYQVKDGWAGVVVGATRWDKGPGAKRWVSSPSTRLTQPIPGWVKVADAHVLGSTTVRGRPAWRVSFYDRGTPGWFTVLVDKTSLRIYQVRMTATAHFMRDDYGSFNTTPAILPPR